MDETSFCSGLSTGRTYDSMPANAQNRIQHLESELYNTQAQLTQLLGMKDKSSADQIRDLSLKLTHKNNEVESLRKKVEEREEQIRRIKRANDTDIKQLRQDVLRLRDENAELKQEKQEWEAAKRDDESKLYQQMLNQTSSSSKGPAQVFSTFNKSKADSSKVVVSARQQSEKPAYWSENPDFFRNQCLDMDSNCGDSLASESRVHISVDAELSMNANGFRDILNLTNSAQANVKNYKNVLKTWKGNMEVLFEQVKATANFLGDIANKMGRNATEKEQIKEVLTKINGMTFNLNLSVDQTKELMEGANGVEESLNELSHIIDDSLRRSMSIIEAQVDKDEHNEVELNQKIVEAQNEVAKYKEEAKDLRKQLEKASKNIETLESDARRREEFNNDEIRQREEEYKRNVEVLETSLIRNRKQVETDENQLIELSEIRQQLEEAQNALHSERKDHVDLKIQHEKLEKELEAAMAELDEFVTECKRAQSEAKAQEQVVEELNEKIQKFKQGEARFRQVAMELEQVKQGVEVFSQELQQCNEALQEAEREKRKLEARQEMASELANRVEALKKDLANAEGDKRQYSEWILKIAEKIPKAAEISLEHDQIPVIVGKIKGYIEAMIRDKADLEDLYGVLEQGNRQLRQNIEKGAAKQGIELEISPVRTSAMKIDSAEEFHKYFDSLVIMAKRLVKKLRENNGDKAQVTEDARQLRLALMNGDEFFKKNKENLKVRLHGMGPDIKQHLGHIHEVLTNIRNSTRK
ncbi:unnamed protein product [Bursaphelenchus okinawaensis]|uniref:Uncharacterized protein n=1 Tax=Bursaphelenchus okinawaensis TaxID=465554 RepID=A0A811JVR6_9BILA|nr:unnamed protein product [Bursaphelenchus okinawaensis]CAG9084835.1 unnamed protein product [Bursaphelenchus okinawaensis]